MKHEILVYNKTPKKIPRKFIIQTTLRALNFLQLKQPTELAVLVVSAKEIKRLNKIWRHKNYTPDELSFGLNSRQKEKFAKRQNRVLELGEIVINGKKIRNKRYLARLLIHSLLHLLGYHHEKSAVKAKKMEQLETKILEHVQR